MWTKEQTESWTTDDLTMDFIQELHSIMGVDLVTEFGNVLKTERPDMFFPFLVALQEYYATKQEEANNE